MDPLALGAAALPAHLARLGDELLAEYRALLHALETDPGSGDGVRGPEARTARIGALVAAYHASLNAARLHQGRAMLGVLLRRQADALEGRLAELRAARAAGEQLLAAQQAEAARLRATRRLDASLDEAAVPAPSPAASGRDSRLERAARELWASPPL